MSDKKETCLVIFFIYLFQIVFVYKLIFFKYAHIKIEVAYIVCA